MMCSETKDIKGLKGELSALDLQMKELVQKVEALEAELAEERRKVNDYQGLLKNLDEYKDKIKNQNREIRRERNRYKQLSEELEEKNRENERKTQELTEIMHLVDAQKDKLKEQKKELMRQKRELDRTNKMLASMNQELSEKNRELNILNEKYFHLSRTDPLTDLYNRRTFIEHLDQDFQTAKRYGRILCCVIFDIDNFKKINDTYGHLQGDEVLRQISKIAKDVSRNCDIVARYGGEEFVVLLPETDVEGGYRLSERLRVAVEKFRFPRFDKPSQHINITISLGVADTKEKGIINHEKLLNCADTALYYSKTHGKNQVKVYRHDDEELNSFSTIIPFPNKSEDIN